MKCKLLIFDLDGTILDTRPGILASVKDTIYQYHLNPLSEEKLLTFIGPPVQISFAKNYGLKGDILQKLADYFRKSYSEVNLLGASPYDNIYDLFQSLKNAGVQTAIATFKREDYAIRLLKHFNFDDYTDIMFGGDNFNKLKKSDIIMECIEKAGITDKSEVVMVGDTIYDAEGAAALGLKFIAVNYGFGFKKGEKYDIQALGYAKNTKDILKIVQGYEG